jgi:hypothetical protein
MNDREIAETRKILRQALQPQREAEPRHDLWPAVLQRLDQHPVRVPWWDWALLAGAIALSCIFPGTIPALLYHL